MVTSELNDIRGLLLSRRENPLGSLQEARESFDQLCKLFPAPPECSFASSVLGGVPVRVATQPSAEASLLYVHGGGFMVGSAEGFEGIAGTLASAVSANAYIIDYRLAPEHPYPAAAEDFLAAYSAILDSCESANEIVLVGDSAGAGLIVASLIQAKSLSMAMPGCVVLFSPWIDLTLTGDSIQRKASVDCFLTLQKLQTCATAFLGPDLGGATFILDSDLSGFPPLMIQVGSDEMLLDDSIRLARNAGVAGVDVKLEVWPCMFHVWQTFAPSLTEGRNALAASADFINAVLGRAKAVKMAPCVAATGNI
ncbi:alpha/beta hydrolase [Pseudomonas sp. MMS21-TM103]|uniref:alpha/beta hydrolase n=1 Tax=Pseudomonas sp. MMS21 TM103 TaxID=2886506 RepID=UPI001EDF02C1|nr:alpha/beta hydrolase [Pseudomonas sp. MMS21 TM103]MCG4454930.1 alpha/beta hydrolase [Pseudomonas sp. MMS21 TM103]